MEESRAYITKKHRFDGMGLKQALSCLLGYEEGERIEFEIRECARQEENNVSPVLVAGALFVSAVFLMLAMAILSLKTLFALGEDRRRYEFQTGRRTSHT